MFEKRALFFMACIFLFFGEDAHPLTLNESIELALENNAGILIKEEEIKKAEAGVKEARSGLLPHLSASANYYNYYDHPYLAYKENYQTNVSLTQILFAGGQLINTLKQSKLNLNAIKESQRRARQEIIFKVKEAFYGVLLSEESVRIHQQSLSLTQEQLRVAKERYHAGEVSSYDVLRAEVEIVRVKTELVKAKTRGQTAQNQFKFILGLALETAVSLKGEFVYPVRKFLSNGAYLPEEVSPDNIFAIAFAMRPELRQMEASRKISELGIKIAKGGSKPTVSLIAGNFWDEKSASSAGNEWDDYRIGLISIDIPLFDGLLARARTQKALAQLNAVKISQGNLKERIELEVKNASLNLQTAQETVASQIKNTEKAEQCLKIMQTRYKEGKAAQLDIIDAQVALSRARVGYAQGIYDYIIARAGLKLAMGEEDK